MTKQHRLTAATTLSTAGLAALLILTPGVASAHGGDEPLDATTTAEILDTGKEKSILGPALVGGGLAAGAAAAFLLLRRKPTVTVPPASGPGDSEN
jgi:hypothetical protein